MPIVYLTEHDTKSYGVKIENNELVKAQKFKNIFDQENNISCVRPLEKFLGKCNGTNMLIKLGSFDKSVFSGNTILLEISDENNKNSYVYVGASKIYSFLTNDHILEYISNMRDNMIPYSIAIGEENINFVSPRCKCIKRAKIKDDELLKTYKFYWSVWLSSWKTWSWPFWKFVRVHLYP